MTKHKIVLEDKQDEYKLSGVAEDRYILDCALEAGIDLPFSCREGNCTSCVGKVLEGEVDRGGTALDLSEEDDGYALLCSSYAKSDCRIAVNVQEDLF
ncbi:2Fe-2S iron-sulfur cluster-binding protein [Halobellus sp. GM3]|uniref:2Fe-2S iron-sulfur cluster-binding protein n=1 Tax=Halobellus sp. GM3 TaxID=3458410 RepID=UPI00403D731D